MSSHLTTHVLDTTAGTPAAGVEVTLTDAHGQDLATAATDADGRAAVGPDRLPAGTYTLTFATGSYFAARAVETFYPQVTVAFVVTDDADGTSSRHYHVPLLLSPFAYSTYRGS
ncbi:hydroxyisourate hydrolase [Isoptericola chiayiensis]|uniref:5-hydroxyisourate hydrolase n=1 Tax=Isoptericola chiayiensis TaxID=579446 RepID=A0ABP8XYL9_9MICO|nr:hydroxyisourate hydrolase [Isoptericola chiayiensis]NOW01134.1 5-hydroxyisourate hydrolase [Isoptericola chiayiensis]